MLDLDIVRLYERRGVKLDSSLNPVGFALDHPEKSEKVSDQDKVLAVIFSRQKLTNKPMNCLELCINEKLSPTVRQYVKDHLLTPVKPDDSPVDPEISSELCRHDGETNFQYENRLRQLAVDQLDYVKSSSQKIKNVRKSAK